MTWEEITPELLELGAKTVAISRELADERSRQWMEEGRTVVGDDAYTNGELERAAATYAFAAGVPEAARGWLQTVRTSRDRSENFEWVLDQVRRLWPWGFEWWKPKDRRRNLVRAGALIIAAIERHDREQARLETGV